MMKELVLNAFRELGFQLEQVGEFGYEFGYEGHTFLYLSNGDDEEFLNIALPGIYQLQEGDDAIYVKLVDKINSTFKYVKTYQLGNNLWLFYERELLGEEDLKQVITRMILHLDAALIRSRVLLEELEEADAEINTEDEEYIEEVEELIEEPETDDMDN